MDYKKLMGYGDKKKVTKKQSKPKVNQVLENIKEEFGVEVADLVDGVTKISQFQKKIIHISEGF